MYSFTKVLKEVHIGNRAWLAMVVLAIGLGIGGQDGTLYKLSEGSEEELSVSVSWEVDREILSYGYLAFAYAIGLGPAGEPTVEDRSDLVPYQGPAPDSNSTQEDIQSLACRPEFQWGCGWILSVIDCESTYRPWVVGTERDEVTGVIYHFYGLLQVYHPDPPGVSNLYLLQPYLNLVKGHIQYVEWKEGIRTSNPWPNCP